MSNSLSKVYMVYSQTHCLFALGMSNFIIENTSFGMKIFVEFDITLFSFFIDQTSHPLKVIFRAQNSKLLWDLKEMIDKQLYSHLFFFFFLERLIPKFEPATSHF